MAGIQFFSVSQGSGGLFPQSPLGFPHFVVSASTQSEETRMKRKTHRFAPRAIRDDTQRTGRAQFTREPRPAG